MKNGKYLFWEDREKFGTKEDFIEELKDLTWYISGNLRYSNVNWDDEDEVKNVFEKEGIKTMKEYFDDIDLETFEESYTTPDGEGVVAFGYYGYDG